MQDPNVIKSLSEAIESGRSAALVTLISTQSSAPRDPGAKMLVYEDGSFSGTVGGGKLEARSIEEAKKALKKGRSGKISFDLTPGGIGAACGGKVEIFVDVYAVELKILILGAGHVGQKIAEVAYLAGLSCSVADERAEFANRERFPHASQILVEKPYKAIKQMQIDSKTYIAIVTRGHSLDRECLEKVLKTNAAYIGMIGSRSKVPVTFRELNKKGLHPEKDKRVFSPIGLNCGGSSPGAVAVSVIAEILKVHNKRDGKHMRKCLKVIPAILLAAVLAASPFVPAFGAVAEKPAESAVSASWDVRLTSVCGKVTIYLADSQKDEGILADVDMPLQHGDRIVTGSDGRAEIVLKSDSVLEIGPSSSLTLESIYRNDTLLGLHAGWLVARLKLSVVNRLRVRTPTALAAVRGTEFAIEVLAGDLQSRQRTVIGVFDEGKLSVTNPDDETGKERILSPRQEIECRRNLPPGRAHRLKFLLRREEQIKHFRTQIARLRRQVEKYSQANRLSLRKLMLKHRNKIRQHHQEMRRKIRQEQENFKKEMHRREQEMRQNIQQERDKYRKEINRQQQ